MITIKSQRELDIMRKAGHIVMLAHEKIKEIIEKDNVTVLFVTHSITSAQAFCERGILLKNGKLIFDGDIKETVEEYQKLLGVKKT